MQGEIEKNDYQEVTPGAPDQSKYQQWTDLKAKNNCGKTALDISINDEQTNAMAEMICAIQKAWST